MGAFRPRDDLGRASVATTQLAVQRGQDEARTVMEQTSFEVATLTAAMNTALLWLPVLIAAPAVLLLGATWGLQSLALRSARRLAARPHFTPEERSRLRALRERYHREPHRR